MWWYDLNGPINFIDRLDHCSFADTQLEISWGRVSITWREN